MYDRIRPMLTVRDLQVQVRPNQGNMANPMSQGNAVWKVLPPSSLVDGAARSYRRPTDDTGILDDIAAVAGSPTGLCVLGDNVIGAANWSDVPLAAQYRAVTEGAGVFVASNMHYMELSGPDAAAALQVLTPRNIRALAAGQAMFTLFTTPEGTIDEEAIVLCTGADEFLVSCGGGKPPSGLPDALSDYPDARARESDVVSFNIKGPKRLQAMQSLVHEGDETRVASLRPFEACSARAHGGEPVWILRTVVGMEMWGKAAVIRQAWSRILQRPHQIAPCGWDLLNVYRMECDLMVFALYPLDVNSGTTLWEAGYGWMFDEGGQKRFVGREALEKSRGKERFWLGGLRAVNPDTDVPPVGAEIFSPEGNFAGYVSSAAFSVKHGCTLAFAHLKPECRPGEVLAMNGYADWGVSRLPFGKA